MEAKQYIGSVADMDLAVDVLVVFGAYMGLTLAAPVVNGVAPVNVPDEVHGVILIVLAEAVGGEYKRALQLGGGFFLADSAADRVELQQKLESRVQGAM